MEYVTTNAVTGKTRRVTLNGREYLVADVSTIVPGVLNGSKGALYYPGEEVAKNPSSWDRIPLLHGHPISQSGQHISAKEPEARAQDLGFIDKSIFNGKLRHQAFFDVQLTRAHDLKLTNKILPRLEKGLPIEVSTGLFTDNEVAPAGSNHNGKPYDFIARNYRPDHLAVLPEHIGACSVNDGCGIHVNSASDDELTPPVINLDWNLLTDGLTLNANPNHDEKGRFASHEEASNAADEASDKAHSRSEDAKSQESGVEDLHQTSIDHANALTTAGDTVSAVRSLRSAMKHAKDASTEHASARDEHIGAAKAHKEAHGLAKKDSDKSAHTDAHKEHMDLAKEHHDKVKQFKEMHADLKSTHDESVDEAKSSVLQDRAFKLTQKAYKAFDEAKAKPSVESHFMASFAHSEAAKANTKAMEHANSLEQASAGHYKELATYHTSMIGKHKDAAMRIASAKPTANKGVFARVKELLGLPSSVVNEFTIVNEWTDAAREASILARQASAKAHQHSYKFYHETTGKSERSGKALELASHASRSAELATDIGGRAGTNKDVSGWHKHAADEHKAAADEHIKEGNLEGARVHREAAKAHNRVVAEREANPAEDKPEAERQGTVVELKIKHPKVGATSSERREFYATKAGEASTEGKHDDAKLYRGMARLAGRAGQAAKAKATTANELIANVAIPTPGGDANEEHDEPEDKPKKPVSTKVAKSTPAVAAGSAEALARTTASATHNCGDDGECEKCKEARSKKKKDQDPDISGESTMARNKAQAIDFLVANCDCWKDKEGRETLNSLKDARVIKLAEGAEGFANATAVVNAVKEELGEELTANEMPEALKKAAAAKAAKGKGKKDAEPDPKDPEEETEGDAETPAMNKGKKMTLTERLKTEGTPEERAVWNTAVRLNKAEKVRILNRLVSHIEDDTRRETTFNKLAKKDLADLQELAELLPTSNNENHVEDIHSMPLYMGASGGPIGNRHTSSKEDREDILELPTINSYLEAEDEVPAKKKHA